MKIVVELPSGPFLTADTCSPIWLSPTIIDSPLCWLVGPLRPADGVTIEKLGSVPFLASVTNCDASCMSAFWGPYRHSANVGQMAHLYGRLWPLAFAFTAP